MEMKKEIRLIDANALIYDIQHNWDYASVDGITATTVLKQTITDIRNQPTVDAVEVVRCNDCKHGIWDEDEGLWKCVYDADFDEQYGGYFGFTEYNDGLHFCSYGERKDNE